MNSGDSVQIGGDSQMRLEQVALHRLEFKKEGNFQGEGPRELKTDFELGVSFPQPGALGVQLHLDARHPDVFECRMTFGALFRLTDAGSKDPKSVLRLFAATVGPAMLYPFLRELFASTLTKAGLPGLLLPVVNWSGVFDPDGIEIPDHAFPSPETEEA